MVQPGYTHVDFPKWLHHPNHAAPSRLVHDEEQEAVVLKEWGLIKEDVDLAADNSRDVLLKRATKLNIKIDQRWSDQRLARAVEEADAKKDT